MSPARLKGDWTSWRDKPYAASRSDEAQKRAALWESLNAYCRENGPAWITTPPGASTAVLEVERGSGLPQKLAKLGYAISELPGTYERLTGAQLSPQAEILRRKGHAINAVSPVMLVDRFEIILPWGAPPSPPMKKRPA
jgi:hypothetical protein